MDPAGLQSTLQQFHQQIMQLRMQLIRARQSAAEAQAELALQRAGRPPKRRIEFTSQYGEDVFAWQLLGMPLEGFYVEAGAFDGYRYSVTYPFEAIGWSGLLVEALPAAAGACRERRPGSRVVHSALSRPDAPETATFHVLDDPYGGMFSFLDPTDLHESVTKNVARSEVTVPVTTLDALLADHDGPIDLMVLDVEGGELAVLDGFDLDRFRPRMMIVEDNAQGRDPALRNLVSGFGYEMVYRLAVNDVFVRSDEREVLERVHWMKLG